MANNENSWAQIEEVRRIVELPSWISHLQDPSRKRAVSICNDLEKGLMFKSDIFTHIFTPDAQNLQRTKNSVSLLLELFNEINARNWSMLNTLKFVSLVEKFDVPPAKELLKKLKEKNREIIEKHSLFENEGAAEYLHRTIVEEKETRSNDSSAATMPIFVEQLMSIINETETLLPLKWKLSVIWNNLYCQYEREDNEIMNLLHVLEMFFVYSNKEVVKCCTLMGMFEILEWIKVMTPELEYQLKMLRAHKEDVHHRVKFKTLFQEGFNESCMAFRPDGNGKSTFRQYTPSEQVIKELIATSNDRQFLKILFLFVENELRELNPLELEDKPIAYFYLSVLERLLLEGSLEVRDVSLTFDLTKLVNSFESENFNVYEDPIDELVVRVVFLIRNEMHYHYQRHLTLQKKGPVLFDPVRENCRNVNEVLPLLQDMSLLFELTKPRRILKTPKIEIVEGANHLVLSTEALFAQPPKRPMVDATNPPPPKREAQGLVAPHQTTQAPERQSMMAYHRAQQPYIRRMQRLAKNLEINMNDI